LALALPPHAAAGLRYRKEPEAAKALTRFLTSPEAAPVNVKMGLQSTLGR